MVITGIFGISAIYPSQHADGWWLSVVRARVGTEKPITPHPPYSSAPIFLHGGGVGVAKFNNRISKIKKGKHKLTMLLRHYSQHQLM